MKILNVESRANTTPKTILVNAFVNYISHEISLTTKINFQKVKLFSTERMYR